MWASDIWCRNAKEPVTGCHFGEIAPGSTREGRINDGVYLLKIPCTRTCVCAHIYKIHGEVGRFAIDLDGISWFSLTGARRETQRGRIECVRSISNLGRHGYIVHVIVFGPLITRLDEERV
jgi:hypothetical protein